MKNAKMWQTIAQGIIVATLMWVGKTIINHGERLAKLEVQQEADASKFQALFQRRQR